MESLSNFDLSENEEFKESRRNSPTTLSIGRSTYMESPLRKDTRMSQ